MNPVIQKLPYCNQVLRTKSTDEINIAYLGGAWRDNTFNNLVMPAIVRLSSIKKINLFLRKQNKLIKKKFKHKALLYFTK